jgi:hypothetical protein
MPDSDATSDSGVSGPVLISSRSSGQLHSAGLVAHADRPAFFAPVDGADTAGSGPQLLYEPGETLIDSDGNPLRLAQRISEGGEGQLFELEQEPALVAKLYFSPSPARHEKLVAMIGKPPAESGEVPGHVSICWPLRLLFNPTSTVAAGFLMPRADRHTHVPLFQMYNQKGRQYMAPGFHWGYLLRTARNIASVVASLHANDCILGDLNESNFLVSPQALVTLVDCDSMQVPKGRGGYFRCPVGKLDFLAPELQGRDYGAFDRSAPQDCFGLATLIFLLLMEGTHPFSGVWLGPGEDSPTGQRIASGDCSYAGSRNVARPRGAPPFDMLPAALSCLFVRCFGEGITQPLRRPSAHQWLEALEAAEGELVTCRRNPQHRHAPHLAACPWCIRTVQLGGADPFPAPGRQREMAPARFRHTVRPWWRRRSTMTAAGGRDSGRQPVDTPRPWGRRLLGVFLVLLASLTGYFLLRPLPPETEKRLQDEHVAQLFGRGQMVRLQDYLADSALRERLLHAPGTPAVAAESFAAARPLWAPDEISCNVPRGTPLAIKTYIDNTGNFSAEGHYSVAVTLPAGTCRGQRSLIIAPMAALPRAMRLLDCPGRGGSLQGFAWHSTEEWSCAPSPGFAAR